MAADPRIRASDDDRDHAASLLREHHAVGRLTPEEFSERLDKVYEARTVGELDELMADLPSIDLYRLPHASMQRQTITGGASGLSALRAPGGVVSGRGRFSPAWQAAWASWFSVSLICFVIWAISGANGVWPLWVAGPWGAIMLGRWITGSGPQSNRPGRRSHGDRDETGGSAPGT